MKYKIKMKNEKTLEGLPSIVVIVVVDVVVVVDELAVRTAWKSTTQSCDLLRVGLNDFIFTFQSHLSPPSANHVVI